MDPVIVIIYQFTIFYLFTRPHQTPFNRANQQLRCDLPLTCKYLLALFFIWKPYALAVSWPCFKSEIQNFHLISLCLLLSFVGLELAMFQVKLYVTPKHPCPIPRPSVVLLGSTHINQYLALETSLVRRYLLLFHVANTDAPQWPLVHICKCLGSTALVHRHTRQWLFLAMRQSMLECKIARYEHGMDQATALGTSPRTSTSISLVDSIHLQLFSIYYFFFTNSLCTE